MPAVPLQCPHCTGLIQVEMESAGHQLGCPLCHGPFVVPPEETLWQLLQAAGPAPPSPIAPSLSVPDQVFTLTCPSCTGPFQVLASMSGQTLGCPHCGSPVAIPPLAPLDEAPAPPPVPEFDVESPRAVDAPDLPSREQRLASEPASDRYPPGMRPPQEREKDPVRTAPPRSASAVDGPSTDRYPPGLAPRVERKPEMPEPAPARQTPRTKRPPEIARSRDADRRLPPATPGNVDDLLPPGAAELPPEVAPQSPSAPFSPPAPTPAKQSEAPAVDDLLPPGAVAAAVPSAMPGLAPASPIDALLPPGAAESPGATEAPARIPQSATVDTLLPPGVAPDSPVPADAGQQVALPRAPKKAPVVPANVPAGAIVVPTPDGGFVTVQEKPKTIGYGDEEVEVRRVSPEERARRRLRNNLIFGGFCLLIILAVVFFLLW